MQPCRIELHYDMIHRMWQTCCVMEQPIRLAFFTYKLSNGQAKICQNKMLIKRGGPTSQYYRLHDLRRIVKLNNSLLKEVSHFLLSLLFFYISFISPYFFMCSLPALPNIWGVKGAAASPSLLIITSTCLSIGGVRSLYYEKKIYNCMLINHKERRVIMDNRVKHIRCY